MKWRDAFRRWLETNDSDLRPVTSDRWAGGTEALEYRLVLGSLSTDPSLAGATNFASVTSESSTTANSAVVPDSSGSGGQSIGTQFNSVSLQPDHSPVNTTKPWNSTTESTEQNFANPLSSSTSENSSDDGLILTSFNSVASLPEQSPSESADSVSASPSTANMTQRDLIATTDPAASTTSATSTNSSSSQNSTTTPGSTTSPPVAIDTSLTAVNTNVLVSSAAVDAAKDGVSTTAAIGTPIVPPWFGSEGINTEIHYDFRDSNGVKNEITAEQIQTTEAVLQEWSAASSGKIQFVRDTDAPISDIVNIGVGDLSAVGLTSGDGGTLATSQHAIETVNGSQTSVGTIWLDHSETWSDVQSSDANSSGTDFATVMAHEVGHTIGLNDDHVSQGILSPIYSGPQDLAGITTAYLNPTFYSTTSEDANGFILDNLNSNQLSSTEVTSLLNRAGATSITNDAIIAIVDRNGNILGVNQQQGAIDAITAANPGAVQSTLAFATDGAVSLARTAAFFANDKAPLTSRTIQNLSQTTILQREVEANPNSSDPTIQGPGFVAPVGIGGNFPAGIEHAPPVDLFNIEASNRVTIDAANTMFANVESYGTTAGIPGNAQNRGIATLPGGIPIYRLIDGTPAELIGGIGVFFPGPDGYATHEQEFVQDRILTVTQEMNTTQALRAEFIAFAALGGSQAAELNGVGGAYSFPQQPIGGYAAVEGIGLPFGHISLNGIQLPLFGSTPGTKGLVDLINQFASQDLTQNVPNTGTIQIFNGGTGTDEASGYLVPAQSSSTSDLTASDITEIIDAGIVAADKVRAAIRLGTDRTGATTRMTFAITDPQGNVLAVYRMNDGTVFSTDVAIAKARNVAYYNDPTQLQAIDQVATSPGGPLIAAGTSFTNRTFRFLAEPFFPSGVNGSEPPEFSILTDADAAGIDIESGHNTGAPAPASAFTSVMGHDVFNPGTNFRDPTDPQNQNGIIFFPGSTALYKNGVLVGGLGVSGDGVDQDDVVTFLAAQGYLPNGTSVTTADQVKVEGIRLPFQKFNRNPFG